MHEATLIAVLEQRMTPSQARALKSAHISHIQTMKPTLFLNLATNQPWGVTKMRSLLRNYLARIDRAYLGTRWCKEPASKRMNGVFTIEGVYTNVHAHGLLRATYGNTLGIQLHSNEIWDKLCPSGSVVAKPITDLQGVANYVLKDGWTETFFEDQIVFASEFMGA